MCICAGVAVGTVPDKLPFTSIKTHKISDLQFRDY